MKKKLKTWYEPAREKKLKREHEQIREQKQEQRRAMLAKQVGEFHKIQQNAALKEDLRAKYITGAKAIEEEWLGLMDFQLFTYLRQGLQPYIEPGKKVDETELKTIIKKEAVEMARPYKERAGEIEDEVIETTKTYEEGVDEVEDDTIKTARNWLYKEEDIKKIKNIQLEDYEAFSKTFNEFTDDDLERVIQCNYIRIPFLKYILSNDKTYTKEKETLKKLFDEFECFVLAERSFEEVVEDSDDPEGLDDVWDYLLKRWVCLYDPQADNTFKDEEYRKHGRLTHYSSDEDDEDILSDSKYRKTKRLNKRNEIGFIYLPELEKLFKKMGLPLPLCLFPFSDEADAGMSETEILERDDPRLKRHENCFAKKGDIWYVRFKGERTCIKDNKRLEYLLHIIENVKLFLTEVDMFVNKTDLITRIDNKEFDDILDETSEDEFLEEIKLIEDEPDENKEPKTQELQFDEQSSFEHLHEMDDEQTKDMPSEEDELSPVSSYKPGLAKTEEVYFRKELYKYFNKFKKAEETGIQKEIDDAEKELERLRKHLLNEHGMATRFSKKGKLHYSQKGKLSEEIERMHDKVSTNISNTLKEDIGEKIPTLYSHFKEYIKITGVKCVYEGGEDWHIDWGKGKD